MSTQAYIDEAVRTPFGRYGGALAGVRPDDLARTRCGRCSSASISWIPRRSTTSSSAGPTAPAKRTVARMAVLLGWLPTSLPGTTVNRLCRSSLEAAIQATRAVTSGDASVVVAGGVESMSRAPWVLPEPEKGYPAGHDTLRSTTIGRPMVNPAMPVPDVEVARDEGILPATSMEKLGTLKAAFGSGGTVTAGNSSPPNDGAAMLLMGNEEAAGERIGRAPLARVVAAGVHGVDADVFGIGPCRPRTGRSRARA